MFFSRAGNSFFLRIQLLGAMVAKRFLESIKEGRLCGPRYVDFVIILHIRKSHLQFVFFLVLSLSLPLYLSVSLSLSLSVSLPLSLSLEGLVKISRHLPPRPSFFSGIFALVIIQVLFFPLPN